MTLVSVLRYFSGWVTVQTEGGYPEKMLNRLTAEHIPVWRVRRKKEKMYFCCFAGDYCRLRTPSRRAYVRMRVSKKHGFPFWIHRYRRRKGLLAAAILYALILFLLAPRIWVIQVNGNTDTPESVILEQAALFGVQIGSRMDRIAIKELEISGLDRLPSLSWITVNPTGCIAQIDVSERKPTPLVRDLSVPSDLVALRDGKILSVLVPGGDLTVQVGEAVSAGTVLATGRRVTEQGEKLYRSYGEVMAQTERQITITVPLLYVRTVLSGKAVCRPTVNFLGWQIPLFCPLEDETLTETKTVSHFLTSGESVLPLGVTVDYVVGTDQVVTARSREQARSLAEKQLKQQEKILFSEADVRETSRSERIMGRSLLLTAHYSCIENIAVEVPISARTEDIVKND